MLEGITKRQASALMTEMRDDPRILANEIVKANERAGRRKAIYGCMGCLGISILLFVGLPMCAVIIAPPVDTSRPEPQSSSGIAPARAVPAAPQTTITLAKFNQIQQGMTYEQVVRILGAEGEVMSETSFGSGQYATHTIMYTWKAGGFMANMNAMFQNGALISKAQLGLK